jgi:hypothetical protein
MRGRLACETLPLRQRGGASFLVGLAVNEVAFEAEMVWRLAWTEANFFNVPICREWSMAPSRRRNGRGEFSTRLLAERPTSCFSALPSSSSLPDRSEGHR